MDYFDRVNVLVVAIAAVIVSLVLLIGSFWEVHQSDITHTIRYGQAVQACKTSPDVALCILKLHP